MDQKTLEKLQATLLEIMLVIDGFCRENGIEYSLGSGTAIGAFRHRGFIPWDDDVDLAMTRSNFVKFCEAWEKKPPEGYYLDFFLYTNITKANHAKVRKDHTLFLSGDEAEGVGHQGIWVDIFPMDKASKDPGQRKKLMNAGRRIILLTRAAVLNPGEPLKKRLTRLALRMIPARVREKLIRNAYRVILENDRIVNDDYEWVSMSCLDSQKILYPKENQTGYKYLEFCGHQFMAFQYIERNLGTVYGDFMQLPPPEKRVNTHDPRRVEFE